MSDKGIPSRKAKPANTKGHTETSSNKTPATPKIRSQVTPDTKAAAQRSTMATVRARSQTSGRAPRSSKAAPSPPPSVLARLRSCLRDPEALHRLKAHLPDWSDEVGAFALIILGVLTLSALFNPSGDIAAPLATALKTTFGMGAYLVALSAMVLGIIMLLPKAGIYITFNAVRIVAIQVAFLSLEGLFHLLEFDPQGRALARDGGGGGYVGWAISSLLAEVIGTWPSISCLSIIAVVGAGMMMGIQRQDIRQGLRRVSEAMLVLAERLRPTPQDITTTPYAVEQAVSLPVAAAESSSAHTELITTPVSATRPAQPEHEHVSPNADWQLVPPPAVMPMPPAPAVDLEPTQAVATVFPAPPKPLLSSETSAIEKPSKSSTTLETTFPKEPSATAVGVPLPWQMPPPPDSGQPTPPHGANGGSSQVIPSEIAEDFDTDLNSLLQDDEEAFSVPEHDNISPLSQVIINGQVITTPLPGNERPSIVPRDDKSVVAPRNPAPTFPLPRKRHFIVDGFHDKMKVGKRSKALPPLELLDYSDLKLPSEDEVNTNASIIEKTMQEFDIDADVIDVRVGPSVTQYAVSPIKEVFNENGETVIIRTRVSKIAALSSDLALALSTKTLRIEAPVPGHSYVGIEVPNSEPSVVSLRSVMESEVFYNERKKPLAVALGRDVSGESVVMNLALMPHLLVAGTTGSGKSVFLRSLIMSLVMNNAPDQLRMIILDPKMVEFAQFNGLPHLLGPVESDHERIIGVLRWATREMDRRYKLLELEKARNIEAYNEILGRRRRNEQMPYIVLVVDEIGDLMMMHPDETEKTLTRLAQKARAAGMHLVVATQRPSVDIITGLIKANFPARISFAVAAGVDSRVILDTIGAETLVGKGDMLFLGPDAAGPKRVQGCFVSDTEVERVVAYWQGSHQEDMAVGETEPSDVAPWENALTRLEELSLMDPVLEEALNLVVTEKQASVSLLQRKLGVGYPRAAHLMDSLYELGIIGSPVAGGKTREVLVRSIGEARRMVQNNRRKKLY